MASKKEARVDKGVLAAPDLWVREGEGGKRARRGLG